jgi:hypothetical protein
MPDEKEEIERQMDALAREYGATHDPRILAELKELAERLRELENMVNTAEQRLLH